MWGGVVERCREELFFFFPGGSSSSCSEIFSPILLGCLPANSDLLFSSSHRSQFARAKKEKRAQEKSSPTTPTPPTFRAASQSPFSKDRRRLS